MQPKKTEKRLCIIVSINSHLPPHVCVCEFLCTRVRACVCKQNPSKQGAMAWNWREPTGRVSPWCRPPPLPLPLLILYHLSLLASEHDGEAGGGGGGRTEPCEWGDEQICGPLCQPQTRIREIVWNSLLGWAKGRREKTAVKCFSLTSSPAHLCFSLLCHFL